MPVKKTIYPGAFGRGFVFNSHGHEIETEDELKHGQICERSTSLFMAVSFNPGDI